MIQDNLAAVEARIAQACVHAGRPRDHVTLLAVSKTFGADAVRALAALGQRAMGENYVQEALDKQAQLRDVPLQWHFIGPIQSNKTRDIARHFDWVHGIDRFKIAQRLSEQRPPTLGPLSVCVQVNISEEASKSGCAPEQTAALCAAVAELPQLHLRGLMAIPAPTAPGGDAQAPYRALRELFERLQSQHGAGFNTLSAGMSDDLEAAIAQGATLVRVGSALFGPRRKPNT